MTNKRSTIGAIFAALLLMMGVAGTALAEVLIDDHQAIFAGWDGDGEPFARDKFDDPFPINQPRCDDIDVAPNEIVFVFVQSGQGTTPNPGGTDANLLDVDLNDGEIFLTDVEASTVGAASVEWVVPVDPPGDELELVSSNSDVDGGELVVQAICFFQDPDTATAGAATVPPDDAIWALVLALGVLLASVVLGSPRRKVEARAER
jgi:hypothetical protein